MQIHRLLKQAAKGRAVAETKCNERSSRSHSVFRLKICGKNDITGESCTGLNCYNIKQIGMYTYSILF